ncbi:hypothetical protein SAMN05216522_113111 [Rosenbergiella nectarea]|uniref:Uncharacterized protein n=1 Tax=Rosenbergiella nectarea TaxID=988801 RepID=A0A1H9M6C8_9GAMM|nr:hypothetical protein [Rosenbergiella nectarea]SER19182.1 hypothetical protein SAMN05216522_113111 [Rosenbergiella nectarea]
MSNRAMLSQIRKRLEAQSSSDNFDGQILSALMDELSGKAPAGTADELEKKFRARTGYKFPQDKEMGELFASIKDADTHIANLRRQINGTHD